MADRTLLRAAAVVGALSVVLTGCSSSSDSSSGSTSSDSSAASDGKLVYGSDGNMGNALGEGLPAGLDRKSVV